MAKYVAAGIAALFVTAEGLELTPDNFEAEVKGSKNAFVKFQAPWYGQDTPPQSPRSPPPHAAPRPRSLQVRPLQTHEARLGPARG